jgi:Polyketide cyclase / dehydrase and lipid transport
VRQVLVVFYYSMILDAPVDDVWEVVSDCACCPAGAHHRQQRLSEGGDPKQVGTVRTNHFNDGTVGIEKLTELSDRHWRVVYDIIGGDPPVDGFTAVITVHEVSEDNRSFVAWSATFEVTGDAGAVADWVRTGIFQTCLAELGRVLTKARLGA